MRGKRARAGDGNETAEVSYREKRPLSVADEVSNKNPIWVGAGA